MSASHGISQYTLTNLLYSTETYRYALDRGQQVCEQSWCRRHTLRSSLLQDGGMFIMCSMSLYMVHPRFQCRLCKQITKLTQVKTILGRLDSLGPLQSCH